KRAAYYVCTAALSDPHGQVRAVVEGRCHGVIIRERRGAGGFGYDPLFLIPEYHRTFGELSPRVKHALSHRARALAQLRPALRESGLAPPSIARHLVALKTFYRFLRLEERVETSAVDLLSSPALWERIPQVLSPESVEKLLAAPQPQERFFLRDKAILETMYATGSRASEVVGLKLEDLFIDSRFCKCQG